MIKVNRESELPELGEDDGGTYATVVAGKIGFQPLYMWQWSTPRGYPAHGEWVRLATLDNANETHRRFLNEE